VSRRTAGTDGAGVGREPPRTSSRGTSDAVPSLDRLEEAAAAELAGIEASGGRRALRCTERLEGCRVAVQGRTLVSFGSCDYLGLARDPRLVEAAARAARAHGAGAGAARLLTGHAAPIEALEAELAATFGAPAALVFASGYAANVGVITTLAGAGDLIVSDALSHASAIDGCRLSRAGVRVVPHGDLDALHGALSDAGAFRRVFVLVEGVYSMDGDLAPLADVVAIAEAAGAHVILDDAHGLGALGPDGGGCAARAGVADRIAVLVGNLGKALGSYGAFVLSTPAVRELLVQRARTFVFTCAPPPATVAAARAGLAVLREDPGPTRRLARNVEALHEALAAAGLPVPRDRTMIVPVLVGDGDEALALSRTLAGNGFLVPAIRPPTVPEGASRLRLTVTAAHEAGQIEGVVEALGRVKTEPAASRPVQ